MKKYYHKNNQNLLWYLGYNTYKEEKEMVNAKAYKTVKKYLSAKDDGKDIDGKKFVIDSVFESEMQDGSEYLTVRLAGVEKVLTLNQTNLSLLMAHYGEDTDKWINQSVIIRVVPVNYGGELTKGLQVFFS